MLAYADRALRIELVLRSNQLREWHLHEVAHWNADTGKMLLLGLIKGLEMSSNIRLTDDKLKNLKPSVKMAYFAWLGGQDLKLELKRPTYYRYKAQLKELGIDIGIPRDIEQKDANVIPLMRVLEAQPVGIPDWAFEQGLVVCA